MLYKYIVSLLIIAKPIGPPAELKTSLNPYEFHGWAEN